MIRLAVTGPKVRTGGRCERREYVARLSPITNAETSNSKVSVKMKKEDVLRQYTTPTGAPAFVPGPHRFTSREYLNITYRTDREALVKQVPEPLEVDEPLVRFEVMNMPDTTGYGSYVECGQAAVVRHKEEAANTSSACISTICRRLPPVANSARFRRSSARQSCSSIPIRWSARWITARSAWRARPWATSTSRWIWKRRGRKSAFPRSC